MARGGAGRHTHCAGCPDDEHRYGNNALSLYTVVSVAIFVAYVTLNTL